jgi:hypothetical protein
MDANQTAQKLTDTVNQAMKDGVPIQWVCATLDMLKFNLQFQTYVSEQQGNMKKLAANVVGGIKFK